MPANSRHGGSLERYRAKRSAGRTPEPFGSGPAGGAGAGHGRFVVQKHAARRLHYDFRLELDGVLLSWAVPRGPCLDPKVKRMAVMVENHPLEYADFEGVIPEGNYGAGPVIVWDRGTWVPIEEPVAGLESGKLLFDLHGHKLRGRWTLVRTKGSARDRDTGEKPSGGAGAGEWLLIKKPDGFADPEGERTPPETSVLSGLDIEDVAGRTDRLDRIRELAASLGGVERRVKLGSLRPILCERREQPFDNDEWMFELKLDGFRLLAEVDGGVVKARYRSGYDATQIYPEVALALQSMPYKQAIFDGEVVVFDDTGRPDFGRLQQRAMLSRTRDIARAQVVHPARYMVFDLLAFEGIDLRDVPVEQRKQLLRHIAADTGIVRYVDHVIGRGRDLYASVEALGLEGIVGKRQGSPYRGGRSPNWLKIRTSLVDDFAVVGYKPPRGQSRIGFSGLHLAVLDQNGQWLYAGRVGGGFRDRELEEISAVLAQAPAADYPFATDHPKDTFVEPRLVVSVRYKEWVHGRLLRQPTFVAVRPDKSPEECTMPDRQGRAPEVDTIDDQNEERTVAFTNLGKVFWPEDGYTKGDLIEYYRDIAPWLMPYLIDRPLVLTRYPDGIDGKSFYQKDAPDWAPDWVRTVSIWSSGSGGGWSRHRDGAEGEGREIHYFVCDNVETLLYVTNMGTIPLHIWSSRVSDLARPDWCILDLDPKDAPFSDVIECALAIRRLCDDIELPTVVKTSGSTGLHVLVPLGRQLTYDQSRALAGLIAQLVEAERPDISTTARVIDARGGKVYLDWLQNRHGQLLVAPFSVRPLPGAPVSMPLRWREVGKRLDHTRFTIANARRRLDRMGEDPVASVLSTAPDLLAALERLQARIEREEAAGTGKKRSGRAPRSGKAKGKGKVR